MENSFFRDGAFNYTNSALIGLNRDAAKAAEAGQHITKATLGVLYKDDGTTLFGADKFREAAQELCAADGIFKYSKPDGNNDLAKAFEDHVLKTTKSIPEDIKISTAVTPGGTAAIYSSLQALNHSEIIVGDASWPGYNTIFKQLPGENKAKISKFKLLNEDGKFNFSSFKETLENAIKESKSKQDNTAITVLLNDPAANPTNTSIENINQIIDLLAQHPEAKINLLIDIAYRDLAENKDKDLVSKLGDLFTKVNNPNLNAVILGSASKMLPFYGMRVGHATLLTRNQKISDDWKGYIGGGVRATSSNANTFAQKLVLKVLKDMPKLMDNYQKEAKTLLAKRRKSFEDAFKLGEKAKELQYINPSPGGFFGSIRAKSQDAAKALQKKLKEQYDVFIPVVDKYIRVPYCALKESVLETLAQTIKQAQNEVSSN